MEPLLHDRQCSKRSVWIISLNPFNNLITKVLFYLYFLCDIKELAQVSELISVGGDS